MPPDDLLQRLAERLGPRGFTTDQELIAPWLVDWRGRFRGASAALLSPATTAEVQAVVTMTAAAGVALVPQGGNTSMVAGATPPADGSALLVSTRRLNRIRLVSDGDNMLVAEAGVVLADVHEAAEERERRFPLSLAAKESATIGGLVSTNAGGTQVLRFGAMRSLVLGLEAVLPDGSLFEGLSSLRKDNRGYDLRQLLTGAEGTLGIVTAAALRLVPALRSRAVAWVGLESADAALQLLRTLEAEIGEAVESFELVPADALDLVLRHVPGTRAPLTAAWPWHVLIEAGGQDRGAGERLERALAAALPGASDAVVAQGEAQANALWRLRETISEAERRDGAAVKHDVSVPVSAMPGFIVAARTAVETRFQGCKVLAFGHLGDGNVHFNVRPVHVAERDHWLGECGREVSAFVHDLVIAKGGSISAEHGIGQAKLAEFERLAGSTRLAMLRAIKHAIDPAERMNPGKLVRLAPAGSAE